VSKGVTLIRVRFSPANTHNIYTYDVGFSPVTAKFTLITKLIVKSRLNRLKNQGKEVKSG